LKINTGSCAHAIGRQLPENKSRTTLAVNEWQEIEEEVNLYFRSRLKPKPSEYRNFNHEIV